MMFRIVVKKMSARIFNIARREAFARGEALECVDYIGMNQILNLSVTEDEQVANVLSTLQTERQLEVLEVERIDSSDKLAKRKISASAPVSFSPPKLELIA